MAAIETIQNNDTVLGPDSEILSVHVAMNGWAGAGWRWGWRAGAGNQSCNASVNTLNTVVWRPRLPCLLLNMQYDIWIGYLDMIHLDLR